MYVHYKILGKYFPNIFPTLYNIIFICNGI